MMVKFATSEMIYSVWTVSDILWGQSAESSRFIVVSERLLNPWMKNSIQSIDYGHRQVVIIGYNSVTDD